MHSSKNIVSYGWRCAKKVKNAEWLGEELRFKKTTIAQKPLSTSKTREAIFLYDKGIFKLMTKNHCFFTFRFFSH